MQGGTSFTFVTDGIESALEQARAAAAGNNVAVSGGADVVLQYLRAGLLDEVQVHVAPMLPIELEITRVVESPAVTQIKYLVVR